MTGATLTWTGYACESVCHTLVNVCMVVCDYMNKSHAFKPGDLLWHSSLVIYCGTISPQPSSLGKGYQEKMRQGMGSYSFVASAAVPLLFYLLHIYYKSGVCNIACDTFEI